MLPAVLSEDHERAHHALDAAADALVSAAPLTTRLRLFDLRRGLSAHMKVEERALLPALPAESARAIAKDHEDLRARLARTEEAALDAAVGALTPRRLGDEVARLLSLMEHHDLREREAYAGLAIEPRWPATPPSVGEVAPPETEIAVARYAWWLRARAEPPADWQPTLPPTLPADEAMLAVALRENELLRQWLASPPGRERLGAAYRLTASLQATVGFTLRREGKKRSGP